ncbi:MAG TPA: DUF4199 domain-containing protein [Candidatus Didemnitutus sp.]|nr:DUF4199 domain-containing protein [Candidatus Didemnitutus sp.]
MGTKFTYALALTISQAVFNLLLYFTGFQTEKLEVGQHAGWISLLIMIVVLWLGIKAVREESPDKSLSYGQGLGAGVVISAISSVMSAVYTFIHFKFVNPNFYDYQLEMLHGQWAKKGMSDAQMEQADAMARKFMNPVVSSIFSIVIVLFCGLIVSLILAAILKRAKSVDAPPPVAA